MGYLDQQERVRLQDLVVMGLLGWEQSLILTFSGLGLAVLILCLDQINHVLEPLSQEDGILSARWLTQVLVLIRRLHDVVLHHVLEPVRQRLLLIDRRFGQLIVKIIQRGQQLALINLFSLRV